MFWRPAEGLFGLRAWAEAGMKFRVRQCHFDCALPKWRRPSSSGHSEEYSTESQSSLYADILCAV
jgi:hypothetical protein